MRKRVVTIGKDEDDDTIFCFAMSSRSGECVMRWFGDDNYFGAMFTIRFATMA